MFDSVHEPAFKESLAPNAFPRLQSPSWQRLVEMSSYYDIYILILLFVKEYLNGVAVLPTKVYPNIA